MATRITETEYTRLFNLISAPAAFKGATRTGRFMSYDLDCGTKYIEIQFDENEVNHFSGEYLKTGEAPE